MHKKKDFYYWVAVITFFIGLTMVLASCDSGSKHKNSPSVVEPVTNVRYFGQHEGCIDHYDPLFCGEEYKPGSLNANSVDIVKDENGSFVIINKTEDGEK